ncbi:MAG: amidohydrolase family protein [Phycisphaerae bacterium]|nr:amidohydrolase family protein [Phycisphaerae bacterium]
MRRNRRFVLFSGLLGVLLGGFVHSAVGKERRNEPPLAIVQARIVVDANRVIERGTVVLSGSRIVAFGADVTPPAEARVFDATGLTVYPGFIDAMSVRGMSGEPSDAERARVEEIDPDVIDSPQSATVAAYRRLVHPNWRAEERIDVRESKRGEARRLGFTAALVAPRPVVLAGRAALIAMGEDALRKSVLRGDVTQVAAFITGSEERGPRRRTDPRRMEMPQYPTTTMGAMAAFRQTLLDSAWHESLAAWSQRHPDAERIPLDRDLEALGAVRTGQQPVLFVANTENEIHRALDIAAEFGLRPILAGAREAWRAVDRLKAERVPIVLSLKWSEEPKPKRLPTSRPASGPAEGPLSPVFDDAWEAQEFEPKRLADERMRLWHEEVDTARRLHEAGIPFALGTFEFEKTDEFWKNVRKALERGLPESAVVAALTTNAAGMLGMESALGRIAPGALAHLTLTTGAIGEESTHVRWVIVDGTTYPVIDEDDRRRRRDDGGEPEGEESERGGRARSREREERATSAPTTTATATTTSAPAEPERNYPEYACEIEADRKPRFQTGGDVLLKNATLLTITHGDLEETDLLIRDGEIAKIGKGLSAPAGVRTIDLRGYFVMPGIIDPHSHICSDGGLNELSLSVTCEVRVRDVIDHRDVSAWRALAGGVTTIHTMHGSANTMGGQNATLRLKYGRPAREWLFKEAPRTVKFALGENVKQSNFGRRGTRFPNSRMGVEAVMRRAFDAARAYQRELREADAKRKAGGDPRPVRRDLRLEALADVLAGAIWVHTHCYRADEIVRLLSVAEDFGFRVAVLQHVLEGYRVIPEILRHGVGASTFSDWWAYKIEAYDAIPHNAARMLQAGIVTTVNSDSPELMRHLNIEAAKSVVYGGLSVNDALTLCTLNGARQLGVDRYVGSLDVGKFGDVAVFDGYPIDTTSRCVLTMIDGEVYFQHTELDPDRPRPARPGRQFIAPRPPQEIAAGANEYWIVGGTVHPIRGPAIENGVVVIRDGKIAEVGAKSSAQPPPGSVVVDATGLNVYPGLINAGTSLGLTEIGSVPGSVDTSDIGRFQADLRALSAYNPFAAAVEVTRAAGITSALVLPEGEAFRVEDDGTPRGTVIAGRAGIVQLVGWTEQEARLADGVALCVSLPSLPGDFPRGVKDEERGKQRAAHRRAMAEIEEFFRAARHYAARVDSAGPNERLLPPFERVLRAMSPYSSGRRPVVFRAGSYKQIREALRFADRYELRPIIYGGREAWKCADELAAAKADVIIERATEYPGGPFEPWDSVYRNAGELARAGVRFCFATGGATLAKLLGVEAGMAAAHGLDRERALRAITLDAAEILGVSDRIGSLEPGKSADVIVSQDEPLQATCGVAAVFIRGQPVRLSSKHTRHDALFRSRPQSALQAAPELRGPPPMRSMRQ